MHLAHTGHSSHTVAAATLSEAAGAFLAFHEEVVNLVIVTHGAGLALPHQHGEHELSICGLGVYLGGFMKQVKLSLITSPSSHAPSRPHTPPDTHTHTLLPQYIGAEWTDCRLGNGKVSTQTNKQ